MPREYISKNKMELEKNLVEKEKNLISKVDTLRILLEAYKPDDGVNFGEYTKNRTVWDEDEEDIIKSKVLELINRF